MPCIPKLLLLSPRPTPIVRKSKHSICAKQSTSDGRDQETDECNVRAQQRGDRKCNRQHAQENERNQRFFFASVHINDPSSVTQSAKAGQLICCSVCAREATMETAMLPP